MHRHRGIGTTGALVVLGFGAGLLAGFAGGSLFGSAGSGRVGRIVRTVQRTRRPIEPRTALTERVEAALAAEPSLAGSRFEILPVGHRGLALHGWVPARRLRVRAYRIAVAAAGAEPIVNRLLVRGEDDAPPALVLNDSPRSA